MIHNRYRAHTRCGDIPAKDIIKVLGALIDDWTNRLPLFAASGGKGDRGGRLLSATQFQHEISREKLRAARRSFPFCVITFELDPSQRRRRRSLVRLLDRNTRLTDRKAKLGRHTFAVLLVDTPEMGGRSALDRLSELISKHRLSVKVELSVHDPDGFHPSDHDDTPPDGVEDRRGQSSIGRQDLASSQGLVASEISASEVFASTTPRSFRGALKRAIDIAGASAGLVLCGPVILAAIAAIRWHDGGPVFFVQTREGRHGKPFKIYKLRTMVVNAESLQSTLRQHSHRDGPAFKIANDPRVTRIGHLLRQTCVDELPQFLNVIKGDMSLVGPRPLPLLESRACDHWHRRRLDVRPGITCYWQVNKKRVNSFDEWMRLDLRYIDQSGLFDDLRLLAQTMIVPISGRGGE